MVVQIKLKNTNIAYRNKTSISVWSFKFVLFVTWLKWSWILTKEILGFLQNSKKMPYFSVIFGKLYQRKIWVLPTYWIRSNEILACLSYTPFVAALQIIPKSKFILDLTSSQYQYRVRLIESLISVLIQCYERAIVYTCQIKCKLQSRRARLNASLDWRSDWKTSKLKSWLKHAFLNARLGLDLRLDAQILDKTWHI